MMYIELFCHFHVVVSFKHLRLATKHCGVARLPDPCLGYGMVAKLQELGSGSGSGDIIPRNVGLIIIIKFFLKKYHY
jgi:hypothetical protein